MGSIIVEPNITVPNIVVNDVNKKDVKGADSIKNTWGVKFPLIEINGYLIPSGVLRNFELTYTLNKLPTITFEIDDSNYEFRRKIVKKEVDKGVIFLGFPDLYIKFNFIVLNLPSDYGGSKIFIKGIFYNEKLYETEQKFYENKSVTDIIKEMCADTGMGLYVTNNEKLSKQIPLELNPNKGRLDFMRNLISKYTNSIYCIDGNGYIHIGDVEKLRESEVDNYQWKDGTKTETQNPIILTNKRKSDETDEVNDNKLYFDFYSIANNHGLEHISTSKTYTIVDDTKQKVDNKSLDFLGLGTSTLNTFKDFAPFFNGGEDFYRNIVGKDLSGKVIDLDMTEICLEITPFSIINLELYLPKLEGVDAIIDEENSGKKIVIGITYFFEQAEDSANTLPRTKQRLFLL